ncbi:MAG: CopG family transcriptional regulator [Spirochaetae bacterium HGW-Spirochaetae-1]|jgi:predicted transcriptional regulator|nr:MAG: CopG family transcriptional regulator [Spirochaetae bacterium HGW-Spirochaetae-1]
MIRTQIQLTEQQAESLKKYSAEMNVSMAELIRDAIDNLMTTRVVISDADKKKKAMEAAGRFRSGNRDLARDHDWYLAETFE